MVAGAIKVMVKVEAMRNDLILDNFQRRVKIFADGLVVLLSMRKGCQECLHGLGLRIFKNGVAISLMFR